MIRAKITSPSGHEGMVIGLSAENIRRLQTGEPIFHDQTEVGFPGVDLILFAAPTEDDCLRILNGITSQSHGPSAGFGERT